MEEQPAAGDYPEQPASYEGTPPPEKKSRTGLIIGIVVGVLLLLCCCCILALLILLTQTGWFRDMFGWLLRLSAVI